MKKQIILTVALLVASIISALAQPGVGGPPGGEGGTPGGGTGIPLDGGAIFLLLAGLILFGYLKFKEKFKNV